ncbi:glycosyltransferase family 2 protein [Algoriphagus taiwanensis]|uniref:glycosyltransferase family 2 protein n=1 Tax=Algoriphagus taiwanensis TaxID=1445656 RepID=UPI0030C74695
MPVYRGRTTLPDLIHRLGEVLRTLGITFELILVDDGCPEDSWSKILECSETMPELRGIKLSRNFGQHYAITAGLDHSQGEWVVVMDCDLQDQPEEIPRLYQEAKKGFDVVLARRVERKDSFFRKLSSKLFYRSLSYLTGSEQDESIGNFGIYHHRVIQEVIGMRESIRYFPTMVKWVGFRQSTLAVAHQEPDSERKTSYNSKKLFNLALDIMLAYSDKPIRLTVKLGVILALTGFGFALFTLLRYWQGEIIVAGYASLIISIWVLSGILLITLGVVGLYLGKTFEGVKNRPIYIIDKKTHS